MAKSILEQVTQCETWTPEIKVCVEPERGTVGEYNLSDYICAELHIPDPSFPHEAFRCNGFQGKEAEKNIKRYIVQQALEGGSSLKATSCNINAKG